MQRRFFPGLRFGAGFDVRAALAQPVEHRIRNAGVRCSSHLGGTIPSFWPTFPHRLRPSQIVSKALI